MGKGARAGRARRTGTVDLEDVRQVTWGASDHEHPAIAPDGRRIAFYAGAYGWIQVYVTGADGVGERPLTCGRGNHTQPAWSPDGRHVFYRAQRANDAPWALWRTTVDDPDERVCLLSDAKASHKHPSPSPDGRTLAWFSDLGSPKNFHLFRAPLVDGALGRPERLTGDRERNDCHPTWSPDGKRLAFHAYMGVDEATTSHVFTCGADGNDVRRLTTAEAMHKHPFFVGPDLVVHHTEEPSGRRFLALRRALDGALVGELTSGKHKDKHPSPFVPRIGPVRIAFASKKRGSSPPVESEPTYDVFVGDLVGVTVPRA